MTDSMTPETRPPTLDRLIERIDALPKVAVRGHVIDHEHGYVTEKRAHVELRSVLDILRDAADLLREEGEAQRSPCVHCGGPNAIVCNRCHSAVAYAPVRPRVDPVPPPPHQDEGWRTAALLKVRTRRAIGQRVAAGESVTDLATEYGVPVAFVERISQPGYDVLSGE